MRDEIKAYICREDRAKKPHFYIFVAHLLLDIQNTQLITLIFTTISQYLHLLHRQINLHSSSVFNLLVNKTLASVHDFHIQFVARA